ncbi:MAG: putative membrane protein [Sphingobacteriales bacterium]|jgi:uncharacterized membrane protein
MKSIIEFIKTTVLGGIVVLLPVTILIAVLSWSWRFLSGLISPISSLIIDLGFSKILADVIVLGGILAFSFIVGYLVRMRTGQWLLDFLEKNLFSKIPGYQLIKETILQLMGNKKSLFSEVCLVKVFGGDTMMTAFITDEHENGTITVFVPTGPNPTSGNIFHVQSKDVFRIKAEAQEAMRTIISCGSGSHPLVGQTNLK